MAPGGASRRLAGEVDAEVAEFLGQSKLPPGKPARRRRAPAAPARPRRRRVPAGAFSVEHFRRWALGLRLDNGAPLELEPFQLAFLDDMFGGVPECWFVVPEGNGKTTLLAAVVLYHAEHRPDAMVPVAASSRDQALVLYRQAKGFVRRGVRLERLFRCYDGYRRVANRENGSQIDVFAADDRTGDGVIPTLCVIDELHRHRSLDLYLTWTGKLDKRGGQLLTISTAGEPGGAFEEARERIRQGADTTERHGCFVRALSSTTVLHEWAVPDDGDPDDLELVKAANPFSGVTLELLARKRRRETMTEEHWRRFTCNLPTRSGLAAISEREWDAAACDGIPAGAPVWLGIDVGWRWDTTALVPLWWESSERRVLGPACELVPPRDGSSLDPYRVFNAIVEIHERNPIEAVVMDPREAAEVEAWIEQELGFAPVRREHSPKEAAAQFASFMTALRNGWLRHSGDRTLRRHALNAVARVLPFGDARFDRPSKTRQGGDQDRRVIDALDAASMAHVVAEAALEAGPARYEVLV